MGELKACKRCGEAKPAAEFHKWKFGRDGLKPVCKQCNVAAATEYQSRNRGARTSYWRSWYRKNRESRGAYMREYEKKNKPYLSVKRSAAARSPIRVASRKAYEARIAENIRLIKRAYKLRRAGLELAAGPYPKIGWLRKCGEEQGWACAMCFRESGGLTIDHVVPLTRGGDNSEGNLQLVCGSCNSRKHNRLLSEIDMRVFWDVDEGVEYLKFKRSNSGGG